MGKVAVFPGEEVGEQSGVAGLKMSITKVKFSTREFPFYFDISVHYEDQSRSTNYDRVIEVRLS